MMEKIKKLIFVLLAVFGVLAMAKSVHATAGINRKINFQGKVVNKGVGATDGTNVTDGNYDFKFSMWTTAGAGSSIWTEVWNGSTSQVSVTSGIFGVALGTYRTFPPTVDFNSDSLYVSVNFNNDGEMTPRVQLTAVPYALNAEKVGGLTVTNTTGTLTIPNGKTISFGDGFTTTGVGITLDQSLATTNSVQFAGLSIGGSVAFTNIAVGTGTTVLFIGSNGNIVAGTLPTGGQTYTATNGLNLAGTQIGLGGTLTSNTKIETSSFNLSITGLGGVQGIYQSAEGQLGIGHTTPIAKLDVAGDLFLGVGSTFSNSAGWGRVVDVYGVSHSRLTARTNTGVSTYLASHNTGYAGAPAGGLVGTISGHDFSIIAGGNVKMTVLSGGNIGIGTTNPAGKLTVASDTNNALQISNAAGTGNFLRISGSNTTDNSASSIRSDGANLVLNGGLAGALYFNFDAGDNIFFKNLSNYVDGVANNLIWSTGSVGIGTTAPSKKLDVAGDINLTGTIFAAGTTGSNGQVLSSTGTGLVWVDMAEGTGTTYTFVNGLTKTGTIVGLGGTLTANTQIGTSSFNMSFLGLGGTQGLFLSSNGSVAIGSTESSYKLHVSGNTNNYLSYMYNVGTSETTGGLFVRTDGIGNILTLNNSGSDVMSVSSVQSVFNNPVSFASAGDVSIAYDLLFTNPDYSVIRSAAAFYLQAGEVYESSNLNLVTYNEGKLVLDTPGGLVTAQAQSWNLGNGTTSTTALNIQSGLVNIDTTNSRVGIGTTAPGYKLDIAGNMRVGTNLSVGGTINLTGVVLGTGTTMLFLDGNGNIVAGTLPDNGTGKSRVVRLSPEFGGASLSADGSIYTGGTMTSDNNLNSSGSGWKNYYEWASGNAALQDYSIIVRISLPSDFASWETGSCPGSTCALEMNYKTGVGTTDDNFVSFIVNNDTDTPGSTVCSINPVANTSWSATGCTESTLNDGSAPEWDDAGETAVIRIKMAAKNTSSALSRIGDILLRYKSKF